LVREGDRDGNPWGLTFQLMFMMNTDSHRFRTAAELEAVGAVLEGNVWRKGEDRWLPLYEAKMAHHFNHRWGDYAMQRDGNESSQLPDVPTDRLGDPAYVVQPRYWVTESAVTDAVADPKATWLLGFRDICRSTDERTLIATVLPFSAVGNVEPLLVSSEPPRHLALLPANLGSFAVDFATRFKVGGTHINFFIAKQLAVLPPARLAERCEWAAGSTSDWLNPRVLELTYTAWDLAGFAQDIGWRGPPFRWDPERRSLLRAELDACFFHLYGIERDDVDYIMETFPIVKREDEAAHGEYRTKRMILEVYDAMAEAIRTGVPYQTVLDPPPADPSLCHPESTRPPWAEAGGR
jgi:hypothetical protein